LKQRIYFLCEGRFIGKIVRDVHRGTPLALLQRNPREHCDVLVEEQDIVRSTLSSAASSSNCAHAQPRPWFTPADVKAVIKFFAAHVRANDFKVFRKVTRRSDIDAA
tara:strand:+ start:992 stop:1312 length:321 start_codon:yes stop_codon:yes gene_type:complete